MASFIVRSSMTLAARPGLFLVGEIKSGTICAGMVARLGSGARAVEAPISGVEFVDHSGERSQVALHLALEVPVETDAASELCASGTTIEVV